MLSLLTGLLNEIWRTFNDAAFYIITGVVVAGLIQAFVDSAAIAKKLGKPNFGSVLLAALIGVPLPLCSCGVIPTAISLRKSGASKGSTLSFLISAPETGVNSIAISYAMLDPLMTIFRPLSAFITAIVAGIGENLFGKNEEAAYTEKAAECKHCQMEAAQNSAKRSFLQKLKYGMKYAFVDLMGDITKWLIIGIVVGGMISYFAPPDLVSKFLGADIKAMFLMLLIGIPLYICASASTPIAAALIAKGMSPGVALVFLLAGPATNLAGILAVNKFLGKRSVIIYLFSIAVCSVLLGLLLNYIYQASGINIKTILGHACDMQPDHIKTVSAVALALSMAYSLWRTRRKICSA
ncbi:MAG: SO_0444 family Cu/Zn efflux transporter [Candidatus Omnitrophota bacterium]|jgi:hypothetical protein